MFRPIYREPDFRNLEAVLQKKAPARPVLFDFIIGADKERFLTGTGYRRATEFERVVTTIRAFDSAGYDFAPIIVRGLSFGAAEAAANPAAATKSLNHEAAIPDRAALSAHRWPRLSDCDFSLLDSAAEYLAPRAKFIPFSLDGILENTVTLTGYENLCYMLYDDPGLAEDIAAEVGKRITGYYKICLDNPHVGAVLLNDDWGFQQQTMVPPDFLRKAVFPFYKEVAAYAHARGKYAVLHSCGCYSDIIEDIIEDIKIDGRHSYEDKIVPVEKAYESLYPRLAVLGGIDVDFLARRSAMEVYRRCKAMVEASRVKGGYALGSGNSVPDYIPTENYLAMLRAALE